MIYLDNAATTYPKAESVYRRIDEANRQLAFNAGRGSYAGARQASAVIEDTRLALLGLANAASVAEVIFTPSATAAFNQIINGLDISQESNVYFSPYEHNAVMRVLNMRQKKAGFAMHEMPLDPQTMEIDMDRLRFMFTSAKPDLVFMSQVSNVTGYILPAGEIAELAKEYGSTVCVDGSQALGLVPVDMSRMAADLYIFAGHKTLYGPFGAAGFFKRRDVMLQPVFAGGTGSDSLNLDMPSDGYERYEAGSHDAVAIAGLLSSLQELPDPTELLEHEQKLTALMIKGLSANPMVKLYLPPAEKQAGIVSFNIRGYRASEVGVILDSDYGIAVRTGYHCAPCIHRHLKDEEYAGTVRASVGRFNSEEDVAGLLRAVDEMGEE